MEIQFGVAKTSCHTREESYETCEFIERPSGGQSLLFCEGFHNDAKGKTASSIIVNKIMAKIAEGQRDSVAIRTVSDQIFRDHVGMLAGSFSMISADFETDTIAVSRCTAAPIYYYQRGMLNIWDHENPQIGSRKDVHPSITEIPFEPGTLIVMPSSGVLKAGELYGWQPDLFTLISDIAEEGSEMNARQIADMILAEAIYADQNKPHDDMAVSVLRVYDSVPNPVRYMHVTIPLSDNTQNYL